MKHDFLPRIVIAWLLIGAILGPTLAAGQARADQNAVIACDIHPATPPAVAHFPGKGCYAKRRGDSVVLGNNYLAIEIPVSAGTIRSVTNRVSGQRHRLDGDQAGFELETDGRTVEWLASENRGQRFEVRLVDRSEESRVVFTTITNGITVAITYRLRSADFWTERRISIVNSDIPTKLEHISYGRLAIPESRTRILELGKFDRPRLEGTSEGGLFAGVGWWFYAVDDAGIYCNTNMAHSVRGEFQSEPWYLGIFQPEAGEPYDGWFWYKTFLQARKAAVAAQSSWSYWNAGWGQWGIDIDDPSAPPYLELMHRLGVRGIAFGSGGAGKGIQKYIELAQTSPVARQNIAHLRKRGIAIGFLEHGGLREKWADEKAIEAKFEQLGEYVKQGYSAFHFDFFSSADTYAAQHNVARYFRAARERLAYTECHLGMANYGPQFQREVLINHPTDLKEFDIGRFSSDWATFLGFRHSRAGWQRRYDYLMPEDGLLYMLTHYSNWGHPRQNTDIEPQQMLYGPHGYCGIAFNFHDPFGFREAFAGAAAFSPYYVFGHVDLKMPERDIGFARAWLKWVEKNSETLRWGRVCQEDESVCVVSKIRDGRGAIFVLNYAPGKRTFKFNLQTGSPSALSIRQVYPLAGKAKRKHDGEALIVEVPGERVAILDVNGGLKGLPPQNRNASPLDLAGWQESGSAWKTQFDLPDIRKALAKAKNPSLPTDLLSLEQLGPGDPLYKQMDAHGMTRKLSRDKLPEAFLKAHGFRDAKLVPTWRMAPWAFADRVWFVYHPIKPQPLIGPSPSLRVNGVAVPLTPRVDYRFPDVGDWVCPLYFADVTEACRFGERNRIELSSPDNAKPRHCYLVSVADRYRAWRSLRISTSRKRTAPAAALPARVGERGEGNRVREHGHRIRPGQPALAIEPGRQDAQREISSEVPEQAGQSLAACAAGGGSQRH